MEKLKNWINEQINWTNNKIIERENKIKDWQATLNPETITALNWNHEMSQLALDKQKIEIFNLVLHTMDKYEKEGI